MLINISCDSFKKLHSKLPSNILCNIVLYQTAKQSIFALKLTEDASYNIDDQTQNLFHDFHLCWKMHCGKIRQIFFSSFRDINQSYVAYYSNDKKDYRNHWSVEELKCLDNFLSIGISAIRFEMANMIFPFPIGFIISNKMKKTF